MANYANTIVFNGITLKVLTLTPVKKQKTIKQVIGKSLVQTKIVGLQDSQWELSGTGVITAISLAELANNRYNIESLDDVSPHTLVDGIHDGMYYMIPGSLQFKDSGERGNISYLYSFKLVEK